MQAPRRCVVSDADLEALWAYLAATVPMPDDLRALLPLDQPEED